MKKPPELELTEKQFEAQVRELAKLFRWLLYKTWRSQHSPAGYPDLTLVRPPRIVFAELKTAKGKTSPEQDKWLAILQSVPHIETYLWRPSDLDEIARILQ